MSPTPTFIETPLNNNNDKENKKASGVGRQQFPYLISKVDDKTNSELLKWFKGEKTGFVQVGPKKWFFPSGYEKAAENIYNFEFKKDDVVIVTFPRSGTTWTQEMVWLLANNLDFEKARATSLNQRCPFLEFSCFVHKETKSEFMKENSYDKKLFKQAKNLDVPEWKKMANAKGRRFIKTHLPFSLLPPNMLEVGCKVLYVARNPKDVAVSFYHLNRSMRTQGYIGDFPRYWDYFERNLQPWTPYWEHIKEAWLRKNEENLMFLFYEDMNKNLKTNVKKVANFLGKSYTKDEYLALLDHLNIENFRNNPSVNFDDLKRLGVWVRSEAGFVRKGESGGWKDYFDDALNDRADKWILGNLRDTDLRFPQSTPLEEKL